MGIILKTLLVIVAIMVVIPALWFWIFITMDMVNDFVTMCRRRKWDKEQERRKEGEQWK